jgi:mRNA interferase RelE/StbE
MFEIKFTPHAQKELEKLSKDIQKRIIKKLTFFASQKDPLAFAKPLVSLPPMTHRFRVGDYRIAFYIVNQTIYIERIRHRRDVYLT